MLLKVFKLSHLIPQSFLIERFFSRQHRGRQHNAHQDEVSKVVVIADFVAEDSKPKQVIPKFN